MPTFIVHKTHIMARDEINVVATGDECYVRQAAISEVAYDCSQDVLAFQMIAIFKLPLPHLASSLSTISLTLLRAQTLVMNIFIRVWSFHPILSRSLSLSSPSPTFLRYCCSPLSDWSSSESTIAGTDTEFRTTLTPGTFSPQSQQKLNDSSLSVQSLRIPWKRHTFMATIHVHKMQITVVNRNDAAATGDVIGVSQQERDFWQGALTKSKSVTTTARIW
ncbi:hypothetical protein BC835DRAFT_1302687 [Cytidiella melzeri]|nr:hypothetical protein BC835DRAFT_1302687 [Cytidiella melzeri]